MNFSKIDILYLNKTPYENGKISGEHFKTIVNKETINGIKILLKNEDSKLKCNKLLKKIQMQFPKYYEEIRGKADGLELDILLYFSILCPELFDLGFEHCTTIMIKKENGNFILSHNEDDDYIEGNFCLSKVKIDNENWFVTNDMYNMPFGNGFSWNSYGIFKTINYCHDEQYNLDYIPRYFSQRHISEASSIDDLIMRCKEMKIASGYHVNAIDINNNIVVSIEVYKESISVKYIDDFYAHTNHYIHEDIDNILIDEGSNSIFRLNKVSELLKESKRDLRTIKNILKYRSPKNLFSESIFQNMSDPYITIANISIDTENKDKVVLDICFNNEKLILDYYLNSNDSL